MGNKCAKSALELIGAIDDLHSSWSNRIRTIVNKWKHADDDMPLGWFEIEADDMVDAGVFSRAEGEVHIAMAKWAENCPFRTMDILAPDSVKKTPMPPWAADQMADAVKAYNDHLDRVKAWMREPNYDSYGIRIMKGWLYDGPEHIRNEFKELTDIIYNGTLTYMAAEGD